MSESDFEGRPYLGVQFECCNVYTRIYRNKAGTAYVGRCPRCFRPARFKVGTEGSGQRFWRAK